MHTKNELSFARHVDSRGITTEVNLDYVRMVVFKDEAGQTVKSEKTDLVWMLLLCFDWICSNT